MAAKSGGTVQRQPAPTPSRGQGGGGGSGGGGASAGTQGMQPGFSAALNAFIAASGNKISISSGYRSPERQAQLWEQAVRKYGSPEAARKWVAPPGRSNHGRGVAADLSFADQATREWAHANAARFGLVFPMSWEPWHIEPMGARNSSHRDAYTDPPEGSGYMNPRDAYDNGTDERGVGEDPFDPAVQARRLFEIIGGSDAMAADMAAATAGADSPGGNAMETLTQAAQSMMNEPQADPRLEPLPGQAKSGGKV